MAVSKNLFGTTPEGKQAYLYTITNASGAMASFTDFGATIVDIIVPAKDGRMTDVNLGYDSLEGYVNGKNRFGECIGRNGNRIADGKFELNGKLYELEKNEKDINNLHSGKDSYAKRMWDGKVDGERIVFSLHSPDGDQGFPGNFDVNVIYEFTEDNVLRITYEGVSDADTVANMTNHSFFNLKGEGDGDIMDHTLTVFSDAITAVDEHSIPTGELMDVTGTPFDFRTPKVIGQDAKVDNEQLNFTGGYDHNFAIAGSGMRKMVELYSEKSGITMTVSSDCAGIQFYAGNFLTKSGDKIGKNGHEYGLYSGLALETQFFPNSINIKEFAQPILKKNETYKTITEYAFKV